MNDALQQLEAFRRHPALQVTPEQRPAIVGNILHHLMRPYFLKRTPEMQEKFGEPQYQAFTRGLADYCLREYVDSPEPRLTIDPCGRVQWKESTKRRTCPLNKIEPVPITTITGTTWLVTGRD